MIVKDAEAPDYECPQAITSEEYVYCRGSRCMAWRWALVDVVRSTDDKFAPVAEWIEREVSTTHGYCGLAGRP